MRGTSIVVLCLGIGSTLFNIAVGFNPALEIFLLWVTGLGIAIGENTD